MSSGSSGSSVSGDGGYKAASRRRSKMELQEHVLQVSEYWKHITPEQQLDNFKFAKYMRQQWGVVASNPDTYLQPQLVEMLTNLHEGITEHKSSSEKAELAFVSLAKLAEENLAKPAEENSSSVTIQLVKLQEQQLAFFKAREDVEKLTAQAKALQKTTSILDCIDTERVRLVFLGYNALDQQKDRYCYTMREALCHSEEES